MDRANCFTNAVNCAIAMNTVSEYIINKYFKANEVTCGIGIDAGKMLATKTGVRRHGVEQSNYRNSIWTKLSAQVLSNIWSVAYGYAGSAHRVALHTFKKELASHMLPGAF